MPPVRGGRRTDHIKSQLSSARPYPLRILSERGLGNPSGDRGMDGTNPSEDRWGTGAPAEDPVLQRDQSPQKPALLVPTFVVTDESSTGSLDHSIGTGSRLNQSQSRWEGIIFHENQSFISPWLSTPPKTWPFTITAPGLKGCESLTAALDWTSQNTVIGRNALDFLTLDVMGLPPGHQSSKRTQYGLLDVRSYIRDATLRCLKLGISHCPALNIVISDDELPWDIDIVIGGTALQKFCDYNTKFQTMFNAVVPNYAPASLLADHSNVARASTMTRTYIGMPALTGQKGCN